MHVFRNKARNPALKRKILPSLFREEPAEGEEAVPPMSKAAKVRNFIFGRSSRSELVLSKYARSTRKFQNLKKGVKSLTKKL